MVCQYSQNGWVKTVFAPPQVILMPQNCCLPPPLTDELVAIVVPGGAFVLPNRFLTNCGCLLSIAIATGKSLITNCQFNLIVAFDRG